MYDDFTDKGSPLPDGALVSYNRNMDELDFIDVLNNNVYTDPEYRVKINN